MMFHNNRTVYIEMNPSSSGIEPSPNSIDGWEVVWQFWALIGIIGLFFIICGSCYLLIIYRIWPCCSACYSTWRMSHRSEPQIEV